MQFKNAAEHKAAQEKVAAADAHDAEQAFEAGFVKAAQDLGLTEAEYKVLRAKYTGPTK